MKTKEGYFTINRGGPRRASSPNSKVTPGIGAAFRKAVDAVGLKPGKIVDNNMGGETPKDKQKQVVSGVPKQPNRVAGF